MRAGEVSASVAGERHAINPIVEAPYKPAQDGATR
jgi:hypothetical protein